MNSRVLSIYGKTLQLYQLSDLPDSSANIAACILQSREIFCITIQSKQSSVVYNDPFAKKRKYGYFYLKSIPKEIVHIIDLPDFLTDVLLIQTLHYIQTKITLPVVQNVFETFIQIYSEPDQRIKNTWEVNEFISSLTFKTILPDRLLFHDYSSEESEYFELGLSYDVSEKLIELFCNILDVYQDIQYENLHQNEMAKTIATAYMTKKNIPKKVLTVMENTSFKKYFKYVEFDEEVNLNSVKIIEKEFKVLNEAYFSSKAFFDVMLRFRKLGKYNIHYFFRRAEIFARCGEIYFVRILKVESSLIQPDLKYAYPKSERLDTLIKNYYKDLLNVKLKHSNFSMAV